MEDVTELKRKAKVLKQAACALCVVDSDLPKTIERFLRESDEMEQKIAKLKKNA